MSTESSSRDAPPPADTADRAARQVEHAARPIRRPSRARRIWAGLLGTAGLAVLAVAVWLKPDPRGYGTHQQLGAGPCGMVLTTGLPCPTCGMTTAFAHTVRGQWISAFMAQPAGFALALATIVMVGVCAYSVWTGRVPAPLTNDRIVFRLFVALLVLLVAGWAFKLGVGLLEGTLPIRGAKL